jgi:hypothetical protein
MYPYAQNNNNDMSLSKKTLNTENCYSECTVVILSVPFFNCYAELSDALICISFDCVNTSCLIPDTYLI